MIKKVQIKDVNGKVLFEYEKENNTVKDTLEEGVRQCIDFSNADLRGTDLSYSSLWDANLNGADLSCAKLYNADLREATLSYSILWDANLNGAELSEACLRGADLFRTDLRGANLRCVDLYKANLTYADLRGANLRGADIRYAELCEAKNMPYIPIACPSEGSFIGWKKVYNYLVQLEIPEDAKRSSATTNKCRCSKAKVLSITDLDGSSYINEIVNDRYEPSVTYKVGEMVYPDSFDEVRWNECSNGIHFFINKEEAINYEL